MNQRVGQSRHYSGRVEKSQKVGLKLYDGIGQLPSLIYTGYCKGRTRKTLVSIKNKKASCRNTNQELEEKLAQKQDQQEGWKRKRHDVAVMTAYALTTAAALLSSWDG